MKKANFVVFASRRSDPSISSFSPLPFVDTLRVIVTVRVRDRVRDDAIQIITQAVEHENER